MFHFRPEHRIRQTHAEVYVANKKIYIFDKESYYACLCLFFANDILFRWCNIWSVADFHLLNIVILRSNYHVYYIWNNKHIFHKFLFFFKYFINIVSSALEMAPGQTTIMQCPGARPLAKAPYWTPTVVNYRSYNHFCLSRTGLCESYLCGNQYWSNDGGFLDFVYHWKYDYGLN